MKDYYFYLEPYAFLFYNNKKVVIYNSLNGQGFSFKNTDKIQNICNSLKDNAMCSLHFGNDILEDPDVSLFIQKVRSSFSGDIIQGSIINRDPVILRPTYSNQRAYERILNEKDLSIGEDVINYISVIQIHTTGTCRNNCTLCSMAYKQIPFCTKNEHKLNIGRLKQFLDSIGTISDVNIKVLSAESLNDYDFLKIVTLLNEYSTIKSYYINYLNFDNIGNKYETISLFQTNNFHFYVVFPFDKLQFEVILNYSISISCSSEFIFVVCSLDDIENVQNIIRTYDLKNYDIKPLYNGRNIDFFNKYVFLYERDILNTKLSKREIYSNQSLNSNYFGVLIVTSDEMIYSNIGHEPLGSIKDDLKKLILKEISSNNSWLLKRDMLPCVDCTYQWLCPPPSNYEQIIGKPNLCHLMP